jgi:hypothetical protein
MTDRTVHSGAVCALGACEITHKPVAGDMRRLAGVWQGSEEQQ